MIILNNKTGSFWHLLPCHSVAYESMLPLSAAKYAQKQLRFICSLNFTNYLDHLSTLTNLIFNFLSFKSGDFTLTSAVPGIPLLRTTASALPFHKLCLLS